MRIKTHFQNVFFLLVFLFPVKAFSTDPSPPVNLLRDPSFSEGFSFVLPDFDEAYQKAGRIITNNGPVALSPEMASALMDEDTLWDRIRGSNRIGSLPVQPVWEINSLSLITTPYNASNDLATSGPDAGKPLFGAGNCPGGNATGPCVWHGRYGASEPDSNDIVTLTAGRVVASDPGADSQPDFSLRANFKKQYEVWTDPELAYWDACSEPPIKNFVGSVNKNAAHQPVIDVAALLAVDNRLYIGGGFTKVNGVLPANRVAMLEGGLWSALGSGVNGTVAALAEDSVGNVYAGGAFTEAGGSPANHIAQWDGTAWSSLDTGVNGAVSVLAAENDGPTNLYAAGDFTEAGGVPVNRIARWDGENWNALGSGLNGAVNTMIVVGNDLYVGGDFTVAGGVPANRIAKWDGENWSALEDSGAGVNGPVTSLALTTEGLYVGGDFSEAGGVEVNHITMWDGEAWNALDSGIDGAVHSLVVNSTGDVYVGGVTEAGGGTVNYFIAKWSAESWSVLPLSLNAVGAVSSLAIDDLGSVFSPAGGMDANNKIIKWDGFIPSGLEPNPEVCGAGQITTVGPKYPDPGNYLLPVDHQVVGQGWPHLVLTQQIVGNTRLGDMESLVFKGMIRVITHDKKLQSTPPCAVGPDGNALEWDASNNAWRDCYNPDKSQFLFGFYMYNPKETVQANVMKWFGVLDSEDTTVDTTTVGSRNVACLTRPADIIGSPQCWLDFDVAAGGQIADPSQWNYASGFGAIRVPSYTILKPSAVTYTSACTNSTISSPPPPNTDADPHNLGVNLDPLAACSDSGWMEFEVNIYDATTKGWMQHAGNYATSIFPTQNPDDFNISSFELSYESGAPVDQEVQLKDVKLEAVYKPGKLGHGNANKTKAISGKLLQ